MFGEGLIQALGAMTHFNQFLLITIRTPGWQHPARITVMTNQPVFIFMVSHLDTAVAAFRVPAATVAENDRRIASPIQKQQYLIIFFQGDGDLIEQGLRYGAGDRFIAEIYDADFR